MTYKSTMSNREVIYINDGPDGGQDPLANCFWMYNSDYLAGPNCPEGLTFSRDANDMVVSNPWTVNLRMPSNCASL